MSAKRKSAKKTAKATKKTAKPARKPMAKAAPKKAAAPKRAAARKASKPAGPQIVHWEIQSQSPEKLHGFYADVFGWDVDANNPMKYGMVASGGKDGINGGIGGSPVPGSRVLVYANVPDIDHALGRIQSRGGKTVMPRTDLGMVIMAIYEDPEGNTMGIIEG
jgi:predicted enzyme related to lactoylglutathione lyase